MPENMKRKITVEPSTKSKDAQSQRRPSVFERLGTKASSSGSNPGTSNNENTCRHWAQGGNCPYGKSCKYANTHTLISPSKQRAAKKDIETKQKANHPPPPLKPNNISKDDVNKRLHSTVVVKKSHTGASPDLNWENWDQTDLEYEDEKVLEKRRQLLQRELELQMKRENDEQQKKKKVKKVKKGVSSSSSTSASSSSSTESSSSSDDSSSTSSSTSADSRRKKGKPKTNKRDSSSSTSGTDQLAKKKASKTQGGSVPPSSKKITARKDDQQLSKSKDSQAPKKILASSSKPSQSSGKKRSATPMGRSRHRSQSPSNKDKLGGSSRPPVAVKKIGGRHNSPPPSKRSQSVDHREKRNHSPSPRPSGRDRDRERDKEKDREREREKERERDKERDRDKDQGRSRSPKGKGRDRVSSPRRDSRPLRDPRKKSSPDASSSKDKGSRLSPGKSRQSGSGPRPRDASLDSKHISAKGSPSNARDGDRRESNRTELRDTRDRGAETKKNTVDNRRGDAADKSSRAKENTDRGGHRTGRDESSSRREGDSASNRDSGRKREQQGLLGSTGKSGQDRDFQSKSDKDRNRDPRDNRDTANRDNRDGRDNRDNADPRLSRSNKSLREMKEAEREKEREEALERCRERQRERERKAREEKAREHERELPSLLLITTHNPIKTMRNAGREGSKGNDKLSEKGSDRSRDRDRDRERGSERERGVDRERGVERDRGLTRGLDRGSDRERGLDRSLDRGLLDRERGAERDRGSDRGLERDRGADRPDRERGFDRDRGLDRSSDRDRGLDRDRGSDRGLDRERVLDRNIADRVLVRDVDRDRGLDRGPERGPSERDRIYDRGSDRDRGSERASLKSIPHDRSLDRVHDRGLNRAPTDRNFDRVADRSFEREPDRSVFDRDNPDDRGYSLPPRGREDGRRPIVADDKGYDSPYDSRRGREDRSRYSDQLDRNRYDDPAMPRDDSRRLGSDTRNYPEDRRGRGREGRGSLEPLPWEGRSRGDRVERDRELHDRDSERRRQPYERDVTLLEPRSPVASLKGRDWDAREYSDNRRDWEGRGVRRGPPPDWDTMHRGEWIDKEGPPLEGDWDLYGPGGQGEWPIGREHWGDEWERPVRTPSRLPPRLVPQPPDYLHPEELPLSIIETKDLPPEIVPTIDKVLVKEEEGMKKGIEVLEGSLLLKRPRESDGDVEKPEPKKFCIEEVAPLEPEDLSDISDDDADEILNREEEIVPTEAEPELHNHLSPSAALQPTAAPDSQKKEGEKEKEADAVERLSTSLSTEINRDSADQHSLLQQDDETLDQLDFEEISDEELEEEVRAGLGDALGVDWASLVAESRPRVRTELQPGSARRRWEGYRMLARLGVSVAYAGQDFVDELSAKIKTMNQENKENAETTSSEEVTEPTFLHPVALIHVSFREKAARRKALFASAGPYKRALSARRDLLVRRQLCNLPVNEANVESQGQNTEEIYRVALQLFRKT